MTLYWPVISGLLGLGVVLLVVPIILSLCAKTRLFQRAPDFHHTHTTPIPRAGGLALVIAFMAVEVFGTLVAPSDPETASKRMIVTIASVAMFALGFWDDLKPLGAKKKFVGQILIAVGVWFCGIGIEQFKLPLTENIIDLGAWGILFTVLWLVGMTNLINLIDGVDGLAAGICLILMGLLAYISFHGGGFGPLAFGMAGALLGFLRFNFPPARIYLGDGGAYFLGLQIALFALVNSQKGTILAALVAPLFVLALPILDTALAILRRGLRGLPIFRPDRKHLHHRLIGLGLSRRQTVLLLYSVTLLFMVLGLAAFWSSGKLVPVLLGVVVVTLLLLAGQFSFSREWFAVGRVLGNSREIRKEVQYGLTLTRWLTLEGSRHTSLDGFWEDFVFAARKLGFTSVRLELADGERAWNKEGFNGPTRVSRQELHGGLAGVLELRAPSGSRDEENPASGALENGFETAPAVNASLFEILSELLAESWLNGTHSIRVEKGGTLRFNPGTRPSNIPETAKREPSHPAVQPVR